MSAVSWWHLAARFISDALRSVIRIALRRIRRTAAEVRQEYHLGNWQRVRELRNWTDYPDLKSFLVGHDAQLRLAKIGGRVVRISTCDYYNYSLRALQSVLKEQAGSADKLVELGCGYGKNLFALALDLYWRELEGLDISENGVAAASEIATHFGLSSRMRFGLVDITDREHPGLLRIEGQSVFTHFCIEQLPHDVEAVVRNIRAHNPKRVIHIEPTTELLDLKKPLDLLSWFYVKSVDYQTRLFSVLRKLEACGEIRIVGTLRLDWAPTIHNDGFMFVWEPR